MLYAENEAAEGEECSFLKESFFEGILEFGVGSDVPDLGDERDGD